jgi:uncharacterized membrane protein YvlD (DUF360 family)
MNYLKSLFFNFLTVFFANHILPGIEVIDQTKLPHLGGDLPFAIGLGFLNSLIYPILKLVDRRLSLLRIGMIALVLNFAAYALLKLLPIGIQVSTIEGYIFASAVVTFGSFLTNYLEMKAGQHHHKHEPPSEGPKIHT